MFICSYSRKISAKRPKLYLLIHDYHATMQSMSMHNTVLEYFILFYILNYTLNKQKQTQTFEVKLFSHTGDSLGPVE